MLSFLVFQFVFMTFWGIYAVDRELVFPKALDKIIPSWMNHVMVRYIVVILWSVLFYYWFDRLSNFTICLSSYSTEGNVSIWLKYKGLTLSYCMSCMNTWSCRTDRICHVTCFYQGVLMISYDFWTNYIKLLKIYTVFEWTAHVKSPKQ